MKTSTVHNFAELHDAFSSYRKSTKWNFRGHSCTSWSLTPKAGRGPLQAADDLSMFRTWKRRAIEYMNRTPEFEIDWLAVAQHHGLATRLLDWTVNPLVAAYFAVSGEHENTYAVVYAHFTQRFSPSSKSIALEKEGIRRIRPTGVAARLLRQGGTFTLHVPPHASLENELPSDHRLERILISKDYRKELRIEG